MPTGFDPMCNARHREVGIIHSHMHHPYGVSSDPRLSDHIELRAMREDRLRNEITAFGNDFSSSLCSDFCGLVRGFMAGILKLFSLNDIGIYKRTGEGWCHAGLVEGRLASAIRPASRIIVGLIRRFVFSRGQYSRNHQVQRPCRSCADRRRRHLLRARDLTFYSGNPPTTQLFPRRSEW